MIDELAIRVALRTKLVSLSVISTGSISLAASGTTLMRSTGSFVADGFFPGMEVLAAGFALGGNNALFTIKEVDVQTLTTTRTFATEAEASGRSLTVGLPSRRSWENIEFTPTIEHPYVEEQYLAGPSEIITTLNEGTAGETIVYDPTYRIFISVPDDAGFEASAKYATAILRLFKPNTKMVLANGSGDALRVREKPAPYPGQLISREAGWAAVLVTIPLRLYTLNN